MRPPVQIEPAFLRPPQADWNWSSAGEPGIYSSGPASMYADRPPMQYAEPSLAGLLLPVAALAGMTYSRELGPKGIGIAPEDEPARRSVSGKIRAPVSDEMPDKLPFASAFQIARKWGLKQFAWRGQRFTTKLREEM